MVLVGVQDWEVRTWEVKTDERPFISAVQRDRDNMKSEPGSGRVSQLQTVCRAVEELKMCVRVCVCVCVD